MADIQAPSISLPQQRPSSRFVVAAKRFSRQALGPYLGGRPLRSRALFVKGKRGSRSE